MVAPTRTNVEVDNDTAIITPTNDVAVGEALILSSSYSGEIAQVGILPPGGGADANWEVIAHENTAVLGSVDRPFTTIIWAKLAEAADVGATFLPDTPGVARNCHQFLSYSGVASTLQEAIKDVTPSINMIENAAAHPTAQAFTDITTTVNDAVCIGITGGRRPQNGVPMGNTWGGGLSDIAGADINSAGSGDRVGLDAGSKVLATAGSTGGTVTLTLQTAASEEVGLFYIAVQPAAAGTGVDIDVPLATMAASGQTPAVGTGAAAFVPVAPVSVNELLPAVGTGENIQVPLGSVAAVGQVPAVGTGVNAIVPHESIDIAAFVPAVGTGAAAAVPLAALSVAGLIPAVGTGVAVVVPLEAIGLTAFPPTLPGQVNIIVPLATLDVAGLAPLVGSGVLVDVPLAELDVNALLPAVGTGAAALVPLAQIGLTAFPPTLPMDTVISVPLAAIDIIGHVPGLQVGAYVPPPLVIVAPERPDALPTPFRPSALPTPPRGIDG